MYVFYFRFLDEKLIFSFLIRLATLMSALLKNGDHVWCSGPMFPGGSPLISNICVARMDLFTVT